MLSTGSTILVDATSNTQSTGFAAGASYTWSHTVGAGQKAVLYVEVALWQDVAGTGTISGITYGGQALTLIKASNQVAMRSEIWRLIAPPTGANNIVATVSGNTDGRRFGAISLLNVDQTTPEDVTAISSNTTTGAPSASITTFTDGAYIIDSVSRFGNTALTLASGQSAIYNTSGSSITGTASYRTTTLAGSYTMSYTGSAATDCIQVVVAVRPANDFMTAERSMMRKISSAISVAWKKQFSSSYRPFTIGVSTIGGFDTIPSSGVTVSDWDNYIFNDESSYLMSASYDRALKMPTGGMTMGIFDARLDNTSGRFTPRYMGGTSTLFTSVYKTMRPFNFNAGFNFNGIDNNVPQFVGVTTKPAAIDMRSRTVDISGNDFLYYLRNTYLDQQIMFTGQRTDQVLQSVFQSVGLSTAQYDLDYGINVIPFGLFDVGTRLSDLVDKIVEAENGQVYQSEEGIVKFENRQHWSNSDPIRRIVYTADVVEAASPNFDHLINVVEIKGQQLQKQQRSVVWTLASPIYINANSNTTIFANFDNPMLQIDTPTLLTANTATDSSGTDLTSSFAITSIDKFAMAAKIIVANNSTTGGYLTSLNITGRQVVKVADIYTRLQDDSSVTAYQERPFVLENSYIQNPTWANSYGQMILNDFAEPENLQVIKIRAKPELQLGDLISWQGRSWRIFDIKAVVDPAQGFLQELTLLQRTIKSYFRIGISTIGGSDSIAP